MMNVQTALAISHPGSNALARRFEKKVWKMMSINDVILA